MSSLSLLLLSYGINADIIWYQDTSNSINSDWTQVGGSLLSQSTGCPISASDCWELCNSDYSNPYIYRIDSTKGYQDISFNYDIDFVEGDCTIFSNTQNTDTEWTQIAIYEYFGTDSSINTSLSLSSATDEDYVGVKIQTSGSTSTSCCYLSRMSLQGNPISTPVPTPVPSMYH